MNIETLEDLFVAQLRNAYGTELALLELVEKRDSDGADDLASALETTREETETQVERLEAVFRDLKTPVASNRSYTVEGLVDSRRERLRAIGDNNTDANANTNADGHDHVHDRIALETALTATRLKRRWADELLTLADHLDYPEDTVELLAASAHETHDRLHELEALEFESAGVLS